MDIGTSKEAYNNLNSGGSDIVTLKEKGTYQHRVLAGGHSCFQVFYPTIYKNEENGNLETGWSVVKVPRDEKTILTELALIDAEKKEKLMQTTDKRGTPRSRLAPTESFYYLIFDRNAEELKIQIAQYKRSVHKRILEIEREVDPNDPAKLLHGPSFCYDIIIKHLYKKNEPGPEYSKHEYTVEPYTKSNSFEGVVPVKVWNAEKYSTPWNVFDDKKRRKIFTDEELSLIDKCEISLPEFVAPLSKSDIRELLETKPLNPFATDGNGHPIFTAPNEMYKIMKDYGLSLPSSKKLKKLSNGSEKDDEDFEVEEEKSNEFFNENDVKKNADNSPRPAFAEEDDSEDDWTDDLN